MIDWYRCLGALVLTAAVTLILARVAHRLDLVDHPGGRKDHGGVIPLVGGLAIFAGFALVLPGMPVPADFAHVLVAMLLMVIIGVIDDVREIKARLKLLGQIAAATVLVLGSGAELHSLGDLIGQGDVRLGGLAIPITIFCVVGIINALNMIDGLDGLAGGVSLVSVLALAFAAGLSAQPVVAGLLIVLSGSLAGFLIFNLRLPWQPQARVFLGDAGSNFLGLALAYFAVVLTQSGEAALAPMSAVWMIGLPILDTLTVMVRRMAQRRSPFSAGRDHLHHILIDLGLGRGATMWVLVASAAGLAAVGMAGWRAGIADWIMLWSAVLILVVYYLCTNRVLARLSRASSTG